MEGVEGDDMRPYSADLKSMWIDYICFPIHLCLLPSDRNRFTFYLYSCFVASFLRFVSTNTYISEVLFIYLSYI
jgi:hypothetical protein